MTIAYPVAPSPLALVRAWRYPSDTTGAEWKVLAPLVPAGGPDHRGGRPPTHPRRDIVDAIRYVAHNAPAAATTPVRTADPAYTGTLLTFAAAVRTSVQIVAKLAGQIGFQVLPRRRVVERTLATARRHPRLRHRTDHPRTTNSAPRPEQTRDPQALLQGR
ncbi:hypothetical protein GCM10027575_11180 [Phytohabitans suffuscus]